MLSSSILARRGQCELKLRGKEARIETINNKSSFGTWMKTFILL